MMKYLLRQQCGMIWRNAIIRNTFLYVSDIRVTRQIFRYRISDDRQFRSQRTVSLYLHVVGAPNIEDLFFAFHGDYRRHHRSCVSHVRVLFSFVKEIWIVVLS